MQVGEEHLVPTQSQTVVLLGDRLLHLEYELGPGPDVRRAVHDGGAGAGEILVADGRTGAGAAFHEHGVTGRGEFADPGGVIATRYSSSIRSRGTPTIMAAPLLSWPAGVPTRRR